MKGHIKVTKVYDDHEEVVIDESNILTQGFKVDVVSVLIGEDTEVPKIVPGYFQIGTGSVGYEVCANSPVPIQRSASDVFFKLDGPITDVARYGTNSPLLLQNLHRSFVASSIDQGSTYEEVFLSSFSTPSFQSSSLETSTTDNREWFISLEPKNLTKFFLDSINIRLVIDKQTANGVAMKEFGLFTKSVLSYKDDRPLLCAYKHLTTAITKSPTFKVHIDWNIGFLGNTNIYDNVTPGKL